MTQENAGGKAIRCNCLAGLQLKRQDKMGRFRTKCRFGFSKALPEFAILYKEAEGILCHQLGRPDA
jgi:hypothetical protein